MESILLEKKHALEYIKKSLYSLKKEFVVIDNAKFHHNTSYKNAPSICKYGILTLSDLKKIGIDNYSESFLNILNDTESHVNGIHSVSLSIPGLKDIRHDEFEYNPFLEDKVDFLIDSNVHALRSSTHYGNEYLVNRSILTSEIKSIDIRLLYLIEKKLNDNDIQELVNKYNYLREISKVLVKDNLKISLREMSFSDNFSIDSDELSSYPKLILKH